MTFTTRSGLVKIWGRKVLSGEKTIEDVPKLYNLREAVEEFVEAHKAEATA